MCKLSLEQHVHADTCAKTGAPDELATAAVEVKFYGEELDLMESAACAANKSLSEFAAEAALGIRRNLPARIRDSQDRRRAETRFNLKKEKVGICQTIN